VRLRLKTTTHQARYKAFLALLRDARKEAKLTQVQVAKRLNCPQSYVSKCEAGERRVDAVELQIFAKLYGKKLTYFNVL
jgi:transcriptional regulator with XRE-family HTH domain